MLKYRLTPHHFSNLLFQKLQLKKCRRIVRGGSDQISRRKLFFPAHSGHGTPGTVKTVPGVPAKESALFRIDFSQDFRHLFSKKGVSALGEMDTVKGKVKFPF